MFGGAIRSSARYEITAEKETGTSLFPPFLACGSSSPILSLLIFAGRVLPAKAKAEAYAHLFVPTVIVRQCNVKVPLSMQWVQEYTVIMCEFGCVRSKHSKCTNVIVVSISRGAIVVHCQNQLPFKDGSRGTDAKNPWPSCLNANANTKMNR